jgi:aspartyl-tRNA(Asn)/glutamyl-tRNA(Gln) amidotransferase subunit C
MDSEEVKKIADVARIKLNDQEVRSLSNELDKLLNYFKKVQEIDTSNIKDSNYMHDLKNELREDVVVNSEDETKERIRKEFTKENENLLLAPKSLK